MTQKEISIIKNGGPVAIIMFVVASRRLFLLDSITFLSINKIVRYIKFLILWKNIWSVLIFNFHNRYFHYFI